MRATFEQIIRAAQIHQPVHVLLPIATGGGKRSAREVNRLSCCARQGNPVRGISKTRLSNRGGDGPSPFDPLLTTAFRGDEPSPPLWYETRRP